MDFPIVSGQPVLIDFCNSIFRREDFGEDAKVAEPSRSSLFGRFLARLTYGRGDDNVKLIERLVEALPAFSNPRVLVIGGGTIGRGASRLYNSSNIELVGTDIYPSDETQVVCDAHSLPFTDASFDGVLIQAVLEHVLSPHQVVDEIHRVLRPDGVVLAETPFMQQVHMAAYDFTRYTFGGHRWLFRRFDEIYAGIALGPGIALLWSIAQMARSLGVSAQGTALLTAPFFWIRLLDRVTRRGPAHDGASGFYFLGKRSEKSLVPRDIVSYYEKHR